MLPYCSLVSQNFFLKSYLYQKLSRKNLWGSARPPPPPPPQIRKGHAASYTIEIQDSLDPLSHFTKPKEVVESHLKDLLKTMKGFEFILTLEVTVEKNTFDSETGKRESIHKAAYFNIKAKTITNANEIESELYASQQEILGIIEVWISEGSGWTIDRVDNNYISVVNYKPFKWIELYRTTNRT